MAMAANCETEIVRELASLEGDLETNSYDEKTALDIATEKQCTETSDLLEALLANPMSKSVRAANRMNFLKRVLGEELTNSKEHTVHNNFRMWKAIPFIQCKKDGDKHSWDTNIHNVYCLKACIGVDRITGEDYAVDIGEEKTLGEVPGYKWFDDNKNEISSVKCLLKDVDGFKAAGFEDNNHNLVDIDECSENSTICEPFKVCNNTIGSYACLDPGNQPITQTELVLLTLTSLCCHRVKIVSKQ